MIPAILAALGEAGGGAEAATALAGANNALGSFNQNLTGLPNKLLAVQRQLTSTFDTFVRVLAAPIDTIDTLGKSLERFVRLSNPASVTMFEYKIENAFASVGKIVSPILDSLGHAADKANEAINKLAPAFDPLVDATEEVADIVGNSLVPVFRELAPYLKLSGDMTKYMVTGFDVLDRAFSKLVERVGVGSGFLNSILGGFDENAGKSTAVRSVRRSSAEEIQRDLAQKSITASIAGSQGPKVTTEGWLQQIHTYLTTKFAEDIQLKFKEAIAELLNKLPKPGQVAEQAVLGGGAGNVVANILGMLR